MKEVARKFWLLALAVLLAFGLGVVSCGGCEENNKEEQDDDFDDDNDDDDDDICDNNTPPELTAQHYILEQNELTPPVAIASADTPNFGIYYEYADEDCNLYVDADKKGHSFVKQLLPSESDWQDLGAHPENIGCSSDDSGLIFGFYFGTEPLPAEFYKGQTKWTDACGDESNVMDWEFTVTAK